MDVPSWLPRWAWVLVKWLGWVVAVVFGILAILSAPDDIRDYILSWEWLADGVPWYVLLLACGGFVAIGSLGRFALLSGPPTTEKLPPSSDTDSATPGATVAPETSRDDRSPRLSPAMWGLLVLAIVAIVATGILRDYVTPELRPILVGGQPATEASDEGVPMQDRVWITLGVTIDNIGAPATVGSYRVDIILSPGSEALRANCPRSFDGDRFVLRAPDNTQMVIRTEELLHQQLRRIDRNDRINGMLVCHAQGLTRSLLEREGVEVCFAVADLAEREWAACQPFRELLLS